MLKLKHSFYCIFAVEERKEKQRGDVMAAKHKVRHEIQELNEKLKQSKEAIQVFKTEIQKLTTSNQEAAVVTT